MAWIFRMSLHLLHALLLVTFAPMRILLLFALVQTFRLLAVAATPTLSCRGPVDPIPVLWGAHVRLHARLGCSFVVWILRSGAHLFRALMRVACNQCLASHLLRAPLMATLVLMKTLR